MIDYSPFEKRTEDGPPPDYTTYFYVFMLVFWPVALALGLLAFYCLPEYELRLPTLFVSLVAGAAAVKYYRVKESRETPA
jgi:hypothetical protein